MGLAFARRLEPALIGSNACPLAGGKADHRRVLPRESANDPFRVSATGRRPITDENFCRLESQSYAGMREPPPYGLK